MKVLIVCAHADDEVLGMGATIALHAQKQHQIRVIVLADGETSRTNKKHEIVKRQTMGEKVKKILGIEQYYHCGFPDNKLDTIALLDVIQKIEHYSTSQKFYPDVVYTHFSGDLNIDHRIANQAVLTAFRPVPEQTVKSILTFEVLSSTDWASLQIGTHFNPSVFVDVTQSFEKKIKALKIYEQEMRNSPHSRSIENVRALASFRGMSKGMLLAESFMVERFINPLGL